MSWACHSPPGHTRAAEALRCHAEGARFGAAAIHLDILQCVTPLLRFVYTGAYNAKVRHAPMVWQHVYRSANTSRPDGVVQRLRRWAEQLNSRSLLKEVRKHAPDIIICTHFLPAELMSRLLAAGSLHCPVWQISNLIVVAGALALQGFSHTDSLHLRSKPNA